MFTAKDQKFISEKMQELKTGILCPEGDSLLRFPSSIVSIAHVDEMGQAWFTLPKASIQSLYEPFFNARLDMLRKGVPFVMKAEVSASVIDDPEEIMIHVSADPILSTVISRDVLLVKAVITSIQYQEHVKQAKKHTSWKEFFSQLFFDNTQKTLQGYQPTI